MDVAVHADLTDKDQTVERPTASTTATVDGAKAVWLGSTEVRNITITDTISYTGFEVGNTYRAVATLYKADGTPVVKVTDSMESYVARGAATHTWLYKMMKFVNSTLAYMNSKS